MQGLIATIARLFITTKRHSDVIVVVLIDVHRTCFEGTCHAVRTRNVRCPHARLQTINRVIRQCNRLGFGFKSHGGQDRAENFLTCNRVVLIGHKNRRLNEVTTRFLTTLLPPCNQLGTLGFTRFNVFEHTVHLNVIDNRAHGRCWIQWVTRLKTRHVRGNFFHKRVFDARFNIQTRRRIATLALVVKHIACCCRCRTLHIRTIGEHNVRRFAPEFHPCAFEVAVRCRRHDAFTHRS